MCGYAATDQVRLRKAKGALISMDIPILLEWKNILDILVISFILHRLFLLMRGTVAFQVTIGLVFLWLFQEVANAAGLVLTSWFLEGFGAIAVLPRLGVHPRLDNLWEVAKTKIWNGIPVTGQDKSVS
jgi:DNA integrity scanning protein DisA with diadenylate cyclase activity